MRALPSLDRSCDRKMWVIRTMIFFFFNPPHAPRRSHFTWNANCEHTLRSPSSIVHRERERKSTNFFGDENQACCSECTFEYIGKLTCIASHCPPYGNYALQIRTIFVPKEFRECAKWSQKCEYINCRICVCHLAATQLESGARNQRKFNAINDIFFFVQRTLNRARPLTTMYK